MDMLQTLPVISAGKGKTLYALPGRPDLALMVFRDSLSTHNIVHASEVPGKGDLICAQTVFMAEEVLIPGGLRTHLEDSGRSIYQYLPEGEYEPNLHHHAVVVHRRDKPLIEVITRDFLCGSLFSKHYSKGLDPYGLYLRPGLPLMYRFPVTTLLTPTDKSETDDPIRSQHAWRDYPAEMETGLEVHRLGREYLSGRGITLIDCKTEALGTLVIDDWLNGDCCRFALSVDIEEGAEPAFLDKENFRAIAISRWGEGPRTPLTFTESEMREGLAGYHQAFERITGNTVSEYQRNRFD